MSYLRLQTEAGWEIELRASGGISDSLLRDMGRAAVMGRLEVYREDPGAARETSYVVRADLVAGGREVFIAALTPSGDITYPG